MQIGTFYLPVIGNRAEINERMAGRRTDLYQKMLRNLAEQARYMDEHGYFGVGFTEHHFHVEGEEVSTNPIMLDMFLGMQTKNLRVGQLGLVLPSHNPLRIAEDIAILDQVTERRAMQHVLEIEELVIPLELLLGHVVIQHVALQMNRYRIRSRRVVGDVEDVRLAVDK